MRGDGPPAPAPPFAAHRRPSPGVTWRSLPSGNIIPGAKQPKIFAINRINVAIRSPYSHNNISLVQMGYKTTILDCCVVLLLSIWKQIHWIYIFGLEYSIYLSFDLPVPYVILSIGHGPINRRCWACVGRKITLWSLQYRIHHHLILLDISSVLVCDEKPSCEVAETLRREPACTA